MAEDRIVEGILGEDFIPHFPQPVLEGAGAKYTNVEPDGVHVVVDGKLVTGQNQQSASEYALALYHLLSRENPVVLV